MREATLPAFSLATIAAARVRRHDGAGLRIVSAPSPVMEATDGEDTAFYIHTLAVDDGGKLHLLDPDRIVVRGDTAKTRR